MGWGASASERGKVRFAEFRHGSPEPNLGQISVYGAAACTVDTGLETPRRGVEETMLFGCVATLVHVLPRQTDDNDVANDVDNDGDDDDYYYSAFQLCKAFDLGSEICQAYR